MLVKALSIVSPGGQRIAAGRKTLEVRRWRPPLGPDEDLLVVENDRFLMVDGDEDPGGRAVALVRIGAVRPWTMDDMEAACASTFEPGWLAWELHFVRPVRCSEPVRAARRIYRVEVPILAVGAAAGPRR